MQVLLEGRALELGVEIDSLTESIARKQMLMQKEFELFEAAQREVIERRVEELSELLQLEPGGGLVRIDGTYYEELGIMMLCQEPEETEIHEFEF